MDLDLRKIASTALIIFGAWIAISSIEWRHTTAQAVNTFVVGVGLVALAVIGRGRTGARGAFGACAVVSAWLFFSPWILPGRTPGLVTHHFLLATLAFGFAGTALASPPPELEPLS
jgi:hypothetical protein